MKILITSGGTKIPIDRVRDITNMSSGTFGTRIAEELLRMGHEVFFFRAKDSKSPMRLTVDMVENNGYELGTFSKWHNERLKWIERYQECTYRTFDQYRDRLERCIKINQPDVVVLAAAVSDYTVTNPVNGKIRSNDILTIQLEQLPKIIYLIKEWSPKVKLVGFKLLVDSRSYQLEEAAKRSITENKCEMIVANDLADIKDNQHKVTLVFPNQLPLVFKTDPKDPNYLARMVAMNIVML